MIVKEIYKKYGIYRIVNVLNGKCYIGKTGVNFGDRWDCHRAQLNGGYHDNRYLQNAWNKYGAENFRFEIVEEIDDVSMLNDLEIKYIADYKAKGLSYNLHDGGDGGFFLGKHLSEETKRKIGEKNRVHMTGRKASDTTKAKMSQSQSERFQKWSDDDRAAWGKMMSEKNRGYKWSEEARQRFSERQQNKPNSAKYTPDDIRAIRKKYSDGVDKRELAAEYNTSPSYIMSIVQMRRWKNIS